MSFPGLGPDEIKLYRSFAKPDVLRVDNALQPAFISILSLLAGIAALWLKPGNRWIALGVLWLGWVFVAHGNYWELNQTELRICTSHKRNIFPLKEIGAIQFSWRLFFWMRLPRCTVIIGGKQYHLWSFDTEAVFQLEKQLIRKIGLEPEISFSNYKVE